MNKNEHNIAAKPVVKNDNPETITVQIMTERSEHERFGSRQAAAEYWDQTRIMLETAYYRLASLYKSNVWDLSRLPEKKKVEAKEEIKHRLLDLAFALHFAENTARTWVKYIQEVEKDGRKVRTTTFTPVAEKDRYIVEPRKKVYDLPRVFDAILNFEPGSPEIDEDQDFVPFEI